MAEQVLRFRNWSAAELNEDKTGEWVTWSDYEKAEQRIMEFEAEKKQAMAEINGTPCTNNVCHPPWERPCQCIYCLLGAAEQRIAELERERDEARGAALWLSRRDAADAPPPFVCNVLRAARAAEPEVGG
jgi:hypothetical protein